MKWFHEFIDREAVDGDAVLDNVAPQCCVAIESRSYLVMTHFENLDAIASDGSGFAAPVSDIGQKTNDCYINELCEKERPAPLVGEEVAERLLDVPGAGLEPARRFPSRGV